jgi:hypothetical protein
MVVAAAFVDMDSDDAPRVMAAAKLGRTAKLAAEPIMADRAIKWGFMVRVFVNCKQ